MYSLKISEHLKYSKYDIKNDATLQPLGYNFLPASKGLTMKKIFLNHQQVTFIVSQHARVVLLITHQVKAQT